jgi:hypothetical protein
MGRTRTKSGLSEFELLKSAIQIDISNLDEEVIQHPVLFERVAQLYAGCVSNRDGHKEYLKHIEGRIMEGVKGSMVEAGISKPTVRAVDVGLAQDPEWKTEREKYMELCSDTDRASALKEAYQARGYAIHNISQIYVARLKTEAGIYE